MHEDCLLSWQKFHETKGPRVRVCPACKCKRAGWQPKKYPVAVCGTKIRDNCFCKLRAGHLGNCV